MILHEICPILTQLASLHRRRNRYKFHFRIIKRSSGSIFVISEITMVSVNLFNSVVTKPLVKDYYLSLLSQIMSEKNLTWVRGKLLFKNLSLFLLMFGCQSINNLFNVLILLCVFFLTWVAPPKMFCNWYRI